jgi:DNA-binding FadR family transcriptional regulator
VKFPRAADLLAGQVKRDILSGKYPEGSMLPTEKEMADQLQVSRPTVREALRILEAEGLVTIRPGPRGGPRVERPNTPTVTRSLTTLFQYERVSLADLLEARRAIEPACARVAASRAAPDDVAAMRRSVENMRAGLEDNAVFWSENANFHLALVSAGHNIVLHTLMTALRELIYQFTVGIHIPAEERLNTLAEHTAIMEAIAAHNPDAAAQATYRHLVNSEERLHERWPNLDMVGLNGSSVE